MKKIIEFLALVIPLTIGLNISTANAVTVDAGTLVDGDLFTNSFGIPSDQNDGADFFDSITFHLNSTLNVNVFADNVPQGFSFSRVDLLTGGPAFSFIAQDTTMPINFTETLGAGDYQVNFKYTLATGREFADGSYLGGVSVAAVPEPETYAMMLAGLGILGFVARRRKV